MCQISKELKKNVRGSPYYRKGPEGERNADLPMLVRTGQVHRINGMHSCLQYLPEKRQFQERARLINTLQPWRRLMCRQGGPMSIIYLDFQKASMQEACF